MSSAPQLKCKNRALDDEEVASVEAMPPIDELVPRQTADEQKDFILKIFFPDTETETDPDSVDGVEGDDDLPA